VFRKIQSKFGDKRLAWFTASVNPHDLEYLAGLLQSGSVAPVIEKTYGLDEVPEALRHLGAGHAHGKLVIRI
jgi:NADPH:quinone reductase-like Zn-dependent oxidoreductase